MYRTMHEVDAMGSFYLSASPMGDMYYLPEVLPPLFAKLTVLYYRR